MMSVSAVVIVLAMVLSISIFMLLQRRRIRLSFFSNLRIDMYIYYLYRICSSTIRTWLDKILQFDWSVT